MRFAGDARPIGRIAILDQIEYEYEYEYEYRPPRRTEYEYEKKARTKHWTAVLDRGLCHCDFFYSHSYNANDHASHRISSCSYSVKRYSYSYSMAV